MNRYLYLRVSMGGEFIWRQWEGPPCPLPNLHQNRGPQQTIVAETPQLVQILNF